MCFEISCMRRSSHNFFWGDQDSKIKESWEKDKKIWKLGILAEDKLGNVHPTRLGLA